MVTFTGDHELATSDATAALLHTLVEENRALIVDFSKAEFVDGAILGVLRSTDLAARERGTIFRLQLASTAIVATIFQIAGALAELECASTRDEALAGTRVPFGVERNDDLVRTESKKPGGRSGADP